MDDLEQISYGKHATFGDLAYFLQQAQKPIMALDDDQAECGQYEHELGQEVTALVEHYNATLRIWFIALESILEKSYKHCDVADEDYDTPAPHALRTLILKNIGILFRATEKIYAQIR